MSEAPVRTGSPAVAARIRVIYGDTDMMGVAYYGNYLRWFEAGRNELIRGSGITYKQLEARGLILPVTEAHVKYRTSAHYDDLLEVVTRTRELGRVRVTFEYEIWRDEPEAGSGGPAGPPGERERAGGGPGAPPGERERAGRDLIATGFTRHACLTRDGGKPTRIPGDVAALLRDIDAKAMGKR